MSELWGRFVYEPCLDLVGPAYVNFALVVVATQCLHLVTFWTHSLIYLAIDMYPERFQSLRRWKSQPDVVITRAQIGKAVRVALINQFTVNIVFAVVFYLLIQWRGLRLDAAQFPSALTVLRDFAVFLACEEVGFYYGHRLSHHPRLYASIHKKHHEFTAPIGCAAVYAHPLEHFFVNLAPLTLGPLLMNSHLFTYWLWLTLAVFSTITSHSGYHFPFLPSNEWHDYHHLKFNTNYGTLRILDKFHGTDGMYLNSFQKGRDFFFTHFSDFTYMVSPKQK